MRDSERMLNGRGGRTVYRFNRLVVCGRILIMRLRLVRVLSVWSNQLKMSGGVIVDVQESMADTR